MPRVPPSTKRHRAEGPENVRVAIITVSDTRTAETDESGRLIREALEKRGHSIVRYSICRDKPSQLDHELGESLTAGVNLIIIDGGTGLAPRDITIDTIGPKLEKRIDGFGELFRHLSYEEIGSAAMLSRAVAGVVGSTVVFCLPGSPDAVRLAMERLIMPELRHIIGLVKG